MPQDSPAPVLVWRRGEALLAAEVDAVVEVAAVPPAGDVRSREGDAPLMDLPGLAGDRPGRAVVVHIVRNLHQLVRRHRDSLAGGAVAPPEFHRQSHGQADDDED